MPENNAAQTIAKMYRSLESGDFAEFETCFTADAQIWHNFDEEVQPMNVAQKLLEHLAVSSISVTYLDRRATQVANIFFLQHTLTAKLRSGSDLRIPAMMRIVVSNDGLISWIDEYLDAGAASPVISSFPG